MSSVQLSAPNYRAFSADALADGLSSLGVKLSNEAECEAAQAIAAELISPNVAAASTLKRVQARTRGAVFSFSEDETVTGVLAIVPLSPAGLAAVEDRSFDPLDPADDHLALPGQPLAGAYGWGMAARTRPAARAVVIATEAMHKLWPELPFFTRAATPDGERLITGKWGFVHHPRADDDLLVLLPRTLQEAAA